MSDTLPTRQSADASRESVPDGNADTSDRFEQVREWYRAARDHRHDWRIQADADFAIVAGHQWSEEDAQTLRDQGRPPVTFNAIQAFIDGISGLEVSNRQELRFIPRTIDPRQGGVNELLTNAAKWVRDGCDAEDEESGSFRDCSICGEGWVDTRLNYEIDPDGLILMEQVDPMEMFPDPNSRKANYADAGYLMRVRDLPIDRARALAPDAEDDELDATWARDTEDEADDPHNAREAPFYRNDQASQLDRERSTVRMVEVEWWERVTAYRVLDPTTGRMVRLEPEAHALAKEAAKRLGVPFKSIRDSARRYRKALVGSKLLWEEDGNDQGGFSYKAITGKWDAHKKCFYGLVRAMRDPQMWANKWLSQILHIINSNAKGGLIAEEDAFANKNEAADSWADSESITWTTPGGLDKIRDKPQVQFPTGIMQLCEFAIASIPRVTGVSPEMMGQVDREQAGVLEMQRKQQGMVLLSDFFAHMRRYRKEQGRLVLWLIQTFVSDGRLIRIGGAEEAQFVSLTRDRTAGEYDIVVDDTPSSPNMKERAWAAIMVLLPIMQRMQVPPQALLELLKYSPLPATLTAKLSQIMQQAQQQGQQSNMHPAQIAEMQAKTAVHTAQAQKIAADARAIPQRVQIDAQKVQGDAAERQARVENLRASAIASLHTAGLSADDQSFQQARDAIDALVQAHGAALDAKDQAHTHAMDLMQAMQGAQQQQHQQGIDQGAQALQQQQVEQAAQQPTAPAG